MVNLLRTLFGVLGLSLLLSSCHEERGSMGAALERADSLGAAGQYAQAVKLLEDIRTNPQTTTDEVRQIIELKNKWRLKEAEAELLRLDSALGVTASEIKTALKQFVVKEQGQMQLYTHQALTPEQLGAVPHLRASVDTLGGLQLVSVYVGANPKAHSALRLKRSDASARTPDLPHDEALNYRYTDGERHWELVTYTEANLSDVLPLLEQEGGGTLEVELLSSGRNVFGWRIQGHRLSALESTMRLRKLLLGRQRLRAEQVKYGQRFVRLSQRVQQ